MAEPARSPLRPLACQLATGFGLGLLPKAPGSFGALAALPPAWLLVAAGGKGLLLAALGAVTLLGLWASWHYMAVVRRHDPAAIVIDEVAGQWLSLLPAPLDPGAYLAAFLLFRLFDIAKPWPVGWLDRRVQGPIGVVIDDLAAGLYAALALMLATRCLGS